ncbi:outer membrane protein assembly factor BamA [Thermodesulforhabdus norvegica]|uniref:Outer membrane protein assembly factor BamA n=1 Tax=Thermodesulforhabdus norvegica TaxID=39841 RepID=A0A1I4UQG0_9BACT|nr:outer membrane protein assembly factor BamA [Thermodesulforhabdus norvegica]SFM90980.1 Beta-barrel assembly machine subunit BamA [Thermodesulforhabdus norvegica]
MGRPFKIAMVCVALLFVNLSGPAKAEDTKPRVALVPFTVVGIPESDFSRVFLEVMRETFLDEGLDTVPYEEVLRAVGTRVISSHSEARSLGRKAMWDYVVWGSVTGIGRRLSIDARITPVRKVDEEPGVFYAEAENKEKLAVATGEIARKVFAYLHRENIIAEVRIEGNERIGDDAILAEIKTSPGDILNPKQIAEDIRSVYKMGYFEDIRVDVKDKPGGKVLIFYVKENPIVKDIVIKGNKEIDDKDIMAVVSTKQFSVLKRKQLADDVQSILDLYHQKAFFDAEVTYEVDFPRDPRQARVTFRIKEGKKFYIKKITFEGNKSFTERKLRSVMQTKEKSILFFWDRERGVLKNDVLDTDVDRLTAFYHDHGFMDARVGTPRIEKREDGFYIEIPIEEGQRYKVKSFEITGDEVEDLEKLKDEWHIKEGDYFSRDRLRKDVEMLTRHCMDLGYAHVEVRPKVTKKRDNVEAFINLVVSKGPKVKIGRIEISGNTKTRDKVIRRQFQIAEGDTFSATKIQNSETKLKRLDYFEEIQIEPRETDSPEVMDLHVKVKEKLTGSISAGGGYSSDEGLFVGGEILQRNLMGRGQYLALRAHLGQDTQRYSLGFLEPSLFDSYYFLGVDAYNWVREYSDFTKDAQGFRIRSGRSFGNWSSFSVEYTFENAEIEDVDEDAASIIKEQQGRQIKSSVAFGVERDSTDHPFLPTKGSINRVSVEFASSYLGSDSSFAKYEVASGWYIPLFWKLTGFVKGEVGWINKIGDEPIPLFDRFFLGGINSVRSYEWGELGPRDPETGDRIGGTKYGLFNAEVIFPIFEEINLKGVIFFDAGNAFDEDETFDVSKFKMGIGGGVRWMSPFGPLRIEWAFNPDPDEGDSRSTWQFSMGAFF